MKYAINLNSILPVRAEPSEKSEMVTQLLFGEYCEVFEEENSFIKIKNQFDGYKGWADRKMLIDISATEFDNLQNQDVFKIHVPIADVFCLNNKETHRLSAGSLLPNYDIDSSKFGIDNLTFQIHPSFVTHLPGKNKNGIINTALSFLNTPYLWGGKNIMGIDCSGFIQVAYSINGFFLPRDASEQASCGIKISFDEASAGDLFFFEKEQKITHVGIYLGEGKIIHASGKVKINKVDAKGIYIENKLLYTHYLSTIRRIE